MKGFFDKQQFIELYQIMALISAGVLLGLILTLVLCLKLFPGLAARIRNGIAQALNHANLPKGSRLQHWAFEIAGWLDPKQPILIALNKDTLKPNVGMPPRTWPDESLFGEFEISNQIAANFAYETYLSRNRNSMDGATCVIKVPRNETGQRLLVKELAILDYLREQAYGSTYCDYLPIEIENRYRSRLHVNFFENTPEQFTAEQILNKRSEGLEGRHLAWMFNRMLEGLGFFHRQGTIHGAVLPQHLLFNADTHGLQFVDWTHAKKVGRRFGYLPRRFRSWYPVEALRKQAATPSTDIFMAARCLIYLAGGRPASNQIPNHVPDPICRFLKACLLESPNMRPNDAWELHEEFRDILEDLYGPPKFHHLEI